MKWSEHAMVHGWGVLDQPGIKGIMRQGSNRRPRPRGNPNSNNNNNNKQRSGGGRSSYDSNGPAGKVRGTAQQVLDKYLALGRDAMTAGDRIGAESYFQFAEHYHRIVNVDAENLAAKQESQNINQDRHPPQSAEQPDVIVEVPVVEVGVPEEVVEVAAAEQAETARADDLSVPIAEMNEKPEPAKETAPKAPRRRRSRAKVETPAPVEVDAAADA